jgi:hypothetical protein
MASRRRYQRCCGQEAAAIAAAESETLGECPRQESNLHPALRRRVLYPLSYEGGAELPPKEGIWDLVVL